MQGAEFGEHIKRQTNVGQPLSLTPTTDEYACASQNQPWLRLQNVRGVLADE